MKMKHPKNTNQRTVSTIQFSLEVFMPPRDPRGLLTFLLEALGDSEAPDVLKEDIRRYLEGPAGLSRVVEAMSWADKDPQFAKLVARAEPIVMAKRSESMLKAFSSVMNPRTTLRQALTFVMVARGDLKFGYLKRDRTDEQKRSMREGYLITEIQARAGTDAEGITPANGRGTRRRR